MKIPFIAFYALGLVGFSLIVPLAAMAAHPLEHLNLDFAIVLLVSLLVMPLTAILLFQTFLRQEIALTSPNLLLILLALTGLIFTYYSYELLTDEHMNGLTMFHLVPLLEVAMTLFVIRTILKMK